MTDEKEEFPFALHDDPAPLQNEARPFSSEQMVACEACLRANPPTRLNCLYCGAPLPTTEARAALWRPSLKPLDDWESGYNVVLWPQPAGAAGADAAALEEASALLRIEAVRLQEILAAGRALPVARAASREEAELIERRLRTLHFKVEALSDEELAIESAPPKRIRNIELTAEELAGWTVGRDEPLVMRWSDILLFVAGRILTRRVEVEERPGNLKRGAEVTDAREIFADEAVLDIFISNAARDGGEGGWRITADKFDYSSLGERKGLLARDNFVLLTSVLCEHAPQARFDDEYKHVRQLLNTAWAPAERKMSGGLRRARPGRLNTEAVTIATNEAQFTRYARLCYHLASRRGAVATDR